MATQKRSISFDETVLAEAERLAGLRGGNLSGLVNAALERELRVTRGRELLAADEAELGPVPASVRAQIAEAWPA